MLTQIAIARCILRSKLTHRCLDWFAHAYTGLTLLYLISGAGPYSSIRYAIYSVERTYIPTLHPRRYEFAQYPISILNGKWIFFAMYSVYLSLVFRGMAFLRNQDAISFPVLQVSSHEHTVYFIDLKGIRVGAHSPPISSGYLEKRFPGHEIIALLPSLVLFLWRARISMARFMEQLGWTEKVSSQEICRTHMVVYLRKQVSIIKCACSACHCWRRPC